MCLPTSLDSASSPSFTGGDATPPGLSRFGPFDISPPVVVNSPTMTEMGQQLAISEELTQGERIRLARQAARLDLSFVAAKLGISKRTLERTEADVRRPTRAELVVLAQLTNQDLAFFGVLSDESDDPEALTLPPPLPAVKVEDDRAA